MDNDTQHQQKLKNRFGGMVQEIRQKAQAEAELLPPALERLDLLQAQISTLQTQIKTLQGQCQQAQDQQAQRLEDLRLLVIKVGRITTRTEKFLKEKKSWIPWIS